MRIAFFMFLMLFAFIANAAVKMSETIGSTNEVVFVNQDGEVNATGVATVQEVAEAAISVQIAAAKVEIATATAKAITNEIQQIVDNIVSNRVVVYRRGFADSFAALTIISDDDTCSITDTRWVQTGGSSIVVDIDYICTADVASIKPNVYTHNTLENGKIDFELCQDAWISEPTFTAQEKTFNSVTYSGYYTIRATIPNPDPTAAYFLYIKLDGSNPSGTGGQLVLKNGVSGGKTVDLVFGDKTINVRGGLVKGYTENE